LNEAELRTQILGAAAGLVHIEQKLQQEVAQMCAKLEMMQNEQEKKKGNEEERLNALVCERVEEFEQQLEEKEVARLQEHQQSLEEWLKRSQREFTKKIAEKVDKLKQESETKVTLVLEMCEQVAEQLRMYVSQLKIAEQQLGPELDKGQREPGEPLNFNLGEVTGGVSASAGSSSVATGSLSPAGFFKSDAPEELRYEAEKLADNDQGAMATSWRARYQREKIEVAAEAQMEPTLDAADTQKEPALDLNQSEKNEATADAHMVGSRRSTLLYGNRNEHEMIEGRPVYESTKVSEALADASGGSGTEGGMVLALRDAAGAVQDVLVRVGARTSVSQVRAVALRELMRRGVHSKLVSKLLFSGIFLKDDDIVSTTLLAATSQVGSKGLDARPVVHMILAAAK
jgi:hypothetical protein